MFQSKIQNLKSKIELPVFSGPLDLLLHLIERQELDVTAISLAQVTEQYLQQVEEMKGNRTHSLMDFLVIGARLVLIKSRALLPRPPAVTSVDGDSEDPAEVLVRQLQLYKRFKEAAGWLGRRQEQGWRSYLRVAPPPRPEGKLDLSGVTVATLPAAYLSALRRTRATADAMTWAQGHLLTLEGQIEWVRQQVKETKRVVLFEDTLSEKATRVEVSLTLLAVLELVKRREIAAFQERLFGPIELSANGARPVPPDPPLSQ